MCIRDSLGHVSHGLRERRYAAAVALDRILAGVVGRQCQPNVVAEPIHQKFEVAGAGMHVLFRIVEIRNPEARGGGRHQLHQTDGAALRHGARVETGFDHDDGAQ